MKKITYDNFNSSLEKVILDRLVESGATKYKVRDTNGLESTAFVKCQNYEQALWDLFREEVVEKSTEEELKVFFDYENNRYETFHNLEDDNSRYITMSSNDMRYNFASRISKEWNDLNEEIEKLSGKSK